MECESPRTDSSLMAFSFRRWATRAQERSRTWIQSQNSEFSPITPMQSSATMLEAKSTLSLSREPTSGTEMFLNFCEIRISTLRTTLTRMDEALTTKINLVEPSVARWCETKCSSSRIIKEIG